MSNEKTGIIIVDDHQLVRDGIKALLKDQEDIVITGESSSGKDLEDLINKNKPDLILMDISLPDISGIELTKRVREDHPDINVLILSMYVDEEIIIKAFKNGAMGYLPKNTTKRELISAIRTINKGEEYYSEEVKSILASRMLRKTREEDSEGTKEISKRETEILELLARGLSNQQIGEKLFISTRTVESHKTHIMQKLGLKSNIELYQYLSRKGFI